MAELHKIKICNIGLATKSILHILKNIKGIKMHKTLKQILIGATVVAFTACGGGGSTGETVQQLEGNLTITIVKVDKQANTARIHIVTDINEAAYVFDNNKLISMDEGTVSDGYIIIRSGKHLIKVCSDEPGIICSFEQGILVSHNVDADAYKKYNIEESSGGLTTDGNQLIYGTNNGSIYSLDLGSEESSLLVEASDNSRVGGLTYFDANTYYFSNTDTGYIRKIHIDDSSIINIATLPFPDGLDLFNQKLYAVTTDRSGLLTIMDLKGNKKGTLETNIPDITGIAHTAKNLYILSEDGNIFQVNPNTGASNQIFTNDNLFTKGNNNNGLEAITILNNYVYVSYIDDVSIYKIDIDLLDYE